MANLPLLVPGSQGNQHPREDLRASAVLGALNSEVILVCDGCSSFALDLRGTYNMTIEVSGTVNGIDWMLIPILPVNQASRLYWASATGTTTGMWEGKCALFWKIRARCTGYVSGAANASICASNGVLDDTFRNLTPNIGTILGTVGAATVLTLNSPGVGLRHYINSIRIDRFATALLTTGAAPVAIATSNLPSSLAFSVPSEAAAQGTISTINIDYSRPLVSTNQNSNTSITAPATPNVIWRITAGFFVAP